jgi:prepilin-type N-terminal cleavage/methylation domain-containing protein
MSHTHRSRERTSGFTLIETMFAIAILGIGLLGAAALMAQMVGNSVQSRYMSTESLLASEKLDELNRFAPSDPAVQAPTGGVSGSLTNDITAPQTSAGKTETVAYYDTVQISSGAGAMQEIILGSDPNTGAAQYSLTQHLPDGTITSTISPGAPPAALITSDTIIFKRRWTIEADQPVPHARRFTVLVTLQNTISGATFQSSMVRTFVPDPNNPTCTPGLGGC